MPTTAHELYSKLLNIYKTQYDKLKRPHNKKIEVQDMPENLVIDLYLDGDEDALPPMPALEDDEDVQLEPEETIGERVKLIARKRKKWRNMIKNIDSRQTVN